MVEELNNVSSETKDEYKDNLPWREIKAVRNRMTHAYYNFDSNLLADIIRFNVPEVIRFCETFAEDHGLDVVSGTPISIFPEPINEEEDKNYRPSASTYYDDDIDFIASAIERTEH